MTASSTNAVFRSLARMYVVLAIAAFGAMACGDGPHVPAGTSAPTVRDSAGIEIVEYSFADLEALPLLEPSDTFELSIGEVDGDEPYLFSARLEAARLSDGTLVALERSTMGFRFYSPGGDYIRSAGRRGEGPNEFQTPIGWWVGAGDTIRVWDYALGRITEIAEQGQSMESTQIGSDLGGRPFYLGTFQDGRLLVRQSGVRRGADGLSHRAQYLALAERAPQGDRWIADTLAVWESPQASSGVSVVIFWQPSGGYAYHPDGAIAWDGLTPQVEYLDMTGRITRILRWEQPDPTPTQEQVDIKLEEMFGTAIESQIRATGVDPDRLVPKTDFPALTSVRTHPNGTGSVTIFARPGDDPIPELRTLTRDGRFGARIRGWSLRGPTPPDLERIVTVDADSLDVLRIRVRRLVAVEGGAG